MLNGWNVKGYFREGEKGAKNRLRKMRSICRGMRKIGCEICEEYAKAGGNGREYMRKREGSIALKRV